MHWSHERGVLAERRVQEEMERRGYRMVRQRLRTPFAEVDLLMASLAEYLLIEVKCVSHPDFLERRISSSQKRRLERAREYVEGRSRAPVRLVWAFVQPDGRILLLNAGESG